MAKLYITELAHNGAAESGAQLQIAAVPPLAEQVITVTGASAQSAAFNGATKMVRIATDVPVNLAFGANPTATVSKLYLPSGGVEYFSVVGGMKVAVIQGA